MSGFAIVVAIDSQRGIGLGGDMPWRLPGDMAYFKRITSEAANGKRNAVIMGRKTYASIPPRFRPLAGRLNVVLSRSPQSLDDGVLGARSLDEALSLLAGREDIHQVFVIGGGEVYGQAIAHPLCQTLYVTQIHAEFGCDTHFPAFESGFERVTQSPPQSDNGVEYVFEVFKRR